jgi:hypothetical protein
VWVAGCGASPAPVDSKRRAAPPDAVGTIAFVRRAGEPPPSLAPVIFEGPDILVDVTHDFVVSDSGRPELER